MLRSISNIGDYLHKHKKFSTAEFDHSDVNATVL